MSARGAFPRTASFQCGFALFFSHPTGAPFEFSEIIPRRERSEKDSIACFAELAARREKKNDFAKSKISKKFSKNFFPPRRQATLSWLGGFAFMQHTHKGHQEPGIDFTRGRAHQSMASAKHNGIVRGSAGRLVQGVAPGASDCTALRWFVCLRALGRCIQGNRRLPISGSRAGLALR